MRRTLTMLAAGVIAVTGMASFTPVQAAPARVSPAVAEQAQVSEGIQQVHRRRGHHNHRFGYYPQHSYYPVYPVYRKKHRHRHHGYYPYPYYRQPGVTFSFSFGGGGHHGYRW